MADVSGTDVTAMLNATVGRQYLVRRPGGPDPRACPDCGAALTLKLSRSGGPFIGCTAYPECGHSRALGPEAAPAADDLPPAEQSRVQREEEAARALGFKGWARLLGTDPATGRHLFIRTGLFGPYVQLGLDDEGGMRRAPLSKVGGRAAAAAGRRGGGAYGWVSTAPPLGLPESIGGSPAYESEVPDGPAPVLRALPRPRRGPAAPAPARPAARPKHRPAPPAPAPPAEHNGAHDHAGRRPLPPLAAQDAGP